MRCADEFRSREITAVRLEQPTFRLVQKPDGSYNISDWLAAPEAETPAGEAPAAAGTPAGAPAAKHRTAPGAGVTRGKGVDR